jgi:hypothetical protein
MKSCASDRRGKESFESSETRVKKAEWEREKERNEGKKGHEINKCKRGRLQ